MKVPNSFADKSWNRTRRVRAERNLTQMLNSLPYQWKAIKDCGVRFEFINGPSGRAGNLISLNFQDFTYFTYRSAFSENLQQRAAKTLSEIVSEL
jgi:hypothetical protein